MRYSAIDVSSAHPAYAGHFPGNPVLPAAVLLDEILNAIADSEALPLERCTIGAAKFKRLVGPGDPLQLGFEPADRGVFRFELRSAAAVVAEGTVRFR